MKESKFEILNERPEGMSFNLYKGLLREQSKKLKAYRKGVLIWPSLIKGSFVGFTKDLV